MADSPQGIIQQGDVALFPRTAPVPPAATPVERDGGRVILAYGEVTGHAHALVEDDVWMRSLPNGERFLTLTRPAPLRHEEHTHLPVTALPCGYDVVQQVVEDVASGLVRDSLD